MTTYIVLLRGINVSGQKKIIMAELRDMLGKIKFHEVETYIQSGNVILKSTEGDNKIVAEKVKKGIAGTFGFDVPVVAKTYGELKSIFDNNPFTEASDIENKRIYFALLQETPEPGMISAFQKEKFQGEKFVVGNDCVYLNYTIGAGKAKLSNNVIERKLKVLATSRNYRTMTKLLEMAKE